MLVIPTSPRFVVVLLGVAIVGCRGKSTDARSPSTPNGAADKSLTVDEYVNRGLPSPDKTWTAEDMAAGAKVLEEVAKADRYQLPRFESERSGKVFDRLVTPQDLDQFKDKSVPLETRSTQNNSYFRALIRHVKVYSDARKDNVVGDDELIELTKKLLRTCTVLMDNLEETASTIKKSDPSYGVRMQGINQGRMGAVSLTAGSLNIIGNREVGPEGMKRLISAYQEILPPLVVALPPQNRSDVTQKLESVLQKSDVKEFHPDLEKLRDSINKAIQQ
jgi:hypothetical protein